MAKEYFKETRFTLPEVIKVGSKGHVVEFLYGKDLTRDMVEEVAPGCGCTADIQVLDDRIRATYNDNTNTPLKKGEKTTISKNMTVFIKDGLPLKITNERKVLVWNPEKTKQILHFYGTVEL